MQYPIDCYRGQTVIVSGIIFYLGGNNGNAFFRR
nr:MAG TPA: hypothetical protein [Caudoviricetes sp.]DAZ67134.1 MAG TPA: hypothetical protein [Caudoviricetes sp.]